MRKKLLTAGLCLILASATAQIFEVENFSTLTNIETDLRGQEGLGIRNLLIMYPNPTKDVFTLESPLSVILLIHVIDINGRTVKLLKVNEVNQIEVNISDLMVGVYFVKVQTIEGTSTKKIFKS